ncbi:MAG: GAF domain-containing protein [Thermoanaerobaculaceae bacterium]|nr:GAF domain-containing protein [Thermoanaerobaculaceae bacterium]
MREGILRGTIRATRRRLGALASRAGSPFSRPKALTETLELLAVAGGEIQRQDQELVDARRALVVEAAARRAAETGMGTAHAYFQQVFESVPDGVYQTSLDGKLLMANPGLARILGYDSLEELSSMAVQEHYVDPGQREVWRRRLEVEGVVTDFEAELKRKDGQALTVINNARLVRDARGRPIYYVGVVTDITHRKKAEETLKVECGRLRSILDAMHDGVYIVNQRYDIEYTNPVLERQFGKVNGRKCYEYFHDLKEPCSWCRKDEVIAGSSVRSEWQSFKTGRTYDLFDAPLMNADGSVSKVKFFHDITARKQVEWALQQSEERYRSLVTASALLVWTTDARGEVTGDLPRWRSFTGQTEDEIKGWGWTQALHPDDRERTATIWSHAVAARAMYETEYRVRRHDGEYRLVLARGVPVLNADGSIREWVGTCEDITDRKETERHTSATHALLELFARKPSRTEYLGALLKLLGEWTGSRCVGIRVVDEQRKIPYESYVGFSQDFWESENCLSLDGDQCACTRVVLGKPEAQDLPLMTPAGSFHCPNVKEFVAGLTPEKQARFRGVCVKSGFVSVTIIPIRYQDTVLGAIHLADEHQDRIPLKAVELVESLSPLIGEAVNHFTLEEELRRYAAEQAALYAVTSAATTLLDPDSLLAAALDAVLPVLGADTGWVTLPGATVTDLPRVAASRGLPDSFVAAEVASPLCTGPVCGPLLIGDEPKSEAIPMAACPRLPAGVVAGTGLHSHVGIPLAAGSQVLGILNIAWATAHPFSAAERTLLMSIGGQIGVALEKARFYETSQKRARQLATLNEVGRAISSSLDVDLVLSSLLEGVKQATDADTALVALKDDATGELVIRQAVGTVSPAAIGFRVPPGEGLAGWVIKHGQTTLVPDVDADPRVLARPTWPLGFGSRELLAVPLIAHGETIGVVELFNKGDRSFGEADVSFAEAVAAQAAVAIENARLYEAEQRARQIADTLREASLLLTQTLEMDTVVASLLENLGRLIPYDRARVMMLNAESRLVVRALREVGGPVEVPPGSDIVFDPQANPVLHGVLTSRKSTLIPDTHKHPDWGGRMRPEFTHSWMGVPLFSGDAVIGLYSLAKKEPGFFTEAHLKTAEALSAQASVAIRNAWLFDQVRTGRERLQTLSRRLVEAQESERRRIARELHDQAGQALTSLKLGLHLLERDVVGSEAVASRIADLRRTTDEVAEQLHDLAADLRPASLDHLGLVPTLRQLVNTLSDQGGPTVQFEAVGVGPGRLPPPVETALYRIAQEALTNTIRHARASKVSVLLERRGGRLIALIEDDGVGFEYDAAMRSGRLGLVGMRERAEMLGGHLRVESSPGRGTTVVVEVPFASSRPDRR